MELFEKAGSHVNRPGAAMERIREATRRLGLLGPLVALWLAAAGSGCNDDYAQPGYYGPVDPSDSPTGATADPQGGSPSASGGVPTGTGGMTTTGGMSTMGGMSTTGGLSTTGGMGTTGGVPMMPEPEAGSGGSAPSTGGEEPVATPCDLSGRWLVTMHYVIEGLGIKQYVHVYAYYEIAQTGGELVVEKGLNCGEDGLSTGILGVTVDSSDAWASVREHVTYTGMTGRSMPVDSGCNISFERWYVVKGATIPYYLDPANPLPTAEQPATDTEPGWEDWDQDGEPGIMSRLSGAISGTIHTAPRIWTAMEGTVPDVSSLVRLPLTWDQEANVLQTDNPLLATEGVRSADPALHFVQLARLAPDQATGDDAALCAEIIDLAPILTPEATAAD